MMGRIVDENGNCLKVGGFCTSVDDKYCPSFCDDVVSRQAVLDLFDGMGVHETIDISILCAIIKNLPPVRPQEQTGHWIKSRDCYGNYHFTCSKCGNDIATQYADTWEDKYCSECGAKMVKQKESKKVNCKSTKCENCINHNYCDYEPQESEE